MVPPAPPSNAAGQAEQADSAQAACQAGQATVLQRSACSLRVPCPACFHQQADLLQCICPLRQLVHPLHLKQGIAAGRLKQQVQRHACNVAF